MTKNNNLYADMLPEPLKSNTRWIDADLAIETSLIAILNMFIEKECGNDDVTYHKKTDKHDDETYRGLKQGPACISESFVEIADLYWWFKHEGPQLEAELLADFRKLREHNKLFKSYYQKRKLNNIMEKLSKNIPLTFYEKLLKKSYEKDGVNLDDTEQDNVEPLIILKHPKEKVRQFKHYMKEENIKRLKRLVELSPAMWT